jgi:selenide,water dikinase
VPVLPAAREYVRAGIAPGGTHANWKFLSEWVIYDAALSKEEQLLLCDAQTSGGLLASVPAGDAERLVAALRKAGVNEAALIGRIEEAGGGRITVSAGVAESDPTR